MGSVSQYGTSKRITPEQKSLKKALQILKTFTKNDLELSVSDLAKINNFPKSTVSRILSTLAAENFVHKSEQTGNYRLGIQMFQLGNLAVRDLKVRDVAIPHMKKLSDQFGEAVHLAILTGADEIISLEVTASRFNLKSDIHIGGKVEYYCTAVGKAIWAFLDEKKIQKILRQVKKQYTVNTITDERELQKEIATIQKQGFAVDNMEHESGIRCVGAPIQNHDGHVVAAISISGPSSRISTERIPAFAEAIKKTAKSISWELGFNPQTNLITATIS